jgi:hypothetical protein
MIPVRWWSAAKKANDGVAAFAGPKYPLVAGRDGHFERKLHTVRTPYDVRPSMEQRSLRSSRGQALVETGLIIVGFLAIALGMVTFGHAIAVANMISHATRDGAYMASTWPTRGTCGAISGTTDLETQVKTDIAAVVGTGVANGFTVTVGQSPTPPGASPCNRPPAPLVTVNVSGCVPYLFPIIPFSVGTNCGGLRGFSINTTMVHLDEGV